MPTRLEISVGRADNLNQARRAWARLPEIQSDPDILRQGEAKRGRFPASRSRRKIAGAGAGRGMNVIRVCCDRHHGEAERDVRAGRRVVAPTPFSRPPGFAPVRTGADVGRAGEFTTKQRMSGLRNNRR